MIEIGAILLTIGALLYHSFSVMIGEIIMISTILIIILCTLFRTKQGVVFSIVCGALLLLGGLTLWYRDIPIPKKLFGARAFDAKVVSVDRRLESTIVVVREEESQSRIRATVKGTSAVLPGDRVSVRGGVAPAKDFITDTGRVFQYQAYLESKGIHAVMNTAEIVLVEEGSFSLPRTATSLRHSIADIFARFVTFPFDGVLSGMLVGYQGGLPKLVQALFRDTGVLHVLVLSGYNITLLAGFVALLLKRVSFRIRTGLTIGLIILLVLISGSGVASIRAGIMGSIALFAGLATRTYNPLRALFLAYILFFFLTPGTLFADPGFHLSFLATFFMIAVMPRLEAVFSFVPSTNRINIRELLLLALCVPIFMLPYTMYFSGMVPIATLFANILLAICTPIIMVLGIIVLALSWIPPLASIVGVIVSFIGTGILWILEVFAKLPIWHTPPLAWWGVLGFYTTVIVLLFRKDISQYVSHLQSMLRQHSNLFDS